jgi:hypothetical protein
MLEKLWNAIINFVMFVCPSALNTSAYTEMIFTKYDVRFFRKSVKKIQVSLNSDKTISSNYSYSE